MQNCRDGYPGCRCATGIGRGCISDCQQALQKTLDALLAKRDLMRATPDARVNDRIVEIRERMRSNVRER